MSEWEPKGYEKYLNTLVFKAKYMVHFHGYKAQTSRRLRYRLYTLQTRIRQTVRRMELKKNRRLKHLRRCAECDRVIRPYYHKGAPYCSKHYREQRINKRKNLFKKIAERIQ